MKSYQVRVNPESNAGVSYKESHTQIQRHTHRADGQGKTGSDESNIATSQGMPRMAKSHQKFGTSKERLSPGANRKSKALPTS